MVYYWLYHSQVLRHDLHKTATRPGYKKLLNMAIEIVDLAMKNGGSFHSFLYVYQRVICSIWMYCDTPHNSRHRALWNWLYPLWAAIFNPPLWWGHLGLPISVITKFVRLVAQIFFTQNGMKNICLPLIAHIYIIFSNREGHIQHRTSDHRNESHLSDHGNRYRCKKTMQPGPAVSSFEKVIFTGRLKWFRTVELRDFSETVEETLRAVEI